MTPSASHSLERARILFVLPTLDLGGAERQALLLAETLRSRSGAEVAVAGLFGGTEGQAVRALCKESRIPCLRFNMPEFGHVASSTLTRSSIRHFIRELQFLKPDVVLPYTSLPNVLCGLAWRKSGVSACVWGQRDAGTDAPESPWQAPAIDRTPCFCANSDASRDYLLTHCHASPHRVVVIPNGVRLPAASRNRNAWRSEWGVAENVPVVGMLANVQPLKDHRTLLLAWKEVHQHRWECPPILCLAGQLTPTAPALQQLAVDLGIAPFVRWLGRVEDVAGFLEALDLAVLSSRREGLPNGILEPMAAGLAVVATDNPGNREALDSRQHPFLARAGDASDLAAKLLELLKNAGLRAALANNNRERALSLFSVETLGRRYEELLASLLHGTFASASTRPTSPASAQVCHKSIVSLDAFGR